MTYWKIFWEVSLVVAGTSFACITAIVTARGYVDLRAMIAQLAQRGKGKA
jgi:hypothetical protein